MARTPTSAGYRHVACCIESPDRSGPALAEAVRVAGPVGARLSLVHVTPTAGAFTGGRTSRSASPGAVVDHVHAEAAAWLTPIAQGHGAEAVILTGDAPALALKAWADRSGVDLLVVSPHRRGLARLLGSFAAEVVRDAPCAVLLAAAD